MRDAAARRKFHRLAERNRFPWHHGGSRAANDAWHRGAHPWQYTDGRRRGGRCRDKGKAIAEPARTFLHLADVERRDLAVRDQYGGPDSGANDRSGDPPIWQKVKIALPENPVGTAGLGFDRGQGFDRGIPRNIEIPPAAPVGTEKESATRRPLRLHDGFRRFARHEADGSDHAFPRHAGGEKFGAVPRHAGMIPGDPAKPIAARRKTRRTQKIGTL